MSVIFWGCGGRSGVGLDDQSATAPMRGTNDAGSGAGGTNFAGSGGTNFAGSGGTSSGGVAGTTSAGSGPTGSGGTLAEGGRGGTGGSVPSAGTSSAGAPTVRQPLFTIGPWEVLTFNPGTSTMVSDDYRSVWTDSAERVWFIDSFGLGGQPARVQRWEDGVLQTELSDCYGGLITLQGKAASDRWLAGCTSGLLHASGPAWSPFAARSGHWVWENSPADLWSCCEVTSPGAGFAAFNWDGAKWNPLPLPSLDYQGGALFSGGPHDLWIADRDVLHWDGTTWSTYRSPYVVGWMDVWGDGTNVWAVGPQGVLGRWDGQRFDTQEPAGAELTAIWGRSPYDVWFVGMFGAILHWDGEKLTSEGSPMPVNLLGVWGAGDTLWVTGSQQTLLKRALDPLR